jgi:hypothetical protein
MMYGASPYGALPYAADGRDVRAYFDMTMDLEASLTLKIYVSTGAGYASLPGDALPNQPFRGVLQSFNFRRSIMQDDIGQFTTGSGQMVIDNADANTTSCRCPMRSTAGRSRSRSAGAMRPMTRPSRWRGSPPRAGTSTPTPSPSTSSTFLQARGADAAERLWRHRRRRRRRDLAGKRKPLCFGKPLNVSAGAAGAGVADLPGARRIGAGDRRRL